MKRIYLDVDGCLNAVDAKFPSEALSGWSADSWRKETVNGFPIRWSTELVDELNALVAGGVEVHWLTTWCELAGEMIAPTLGLKGGEDWPVAGGITYELAQMWNYRSPRWWKLGIFEGDTDPDVENQPEKIVWIDDDHYLAGDAVRVTELLKAGRLLRVGPFTSVGITRKDIDDIRAFFSEDTV